MAENRFRKGDHIEFQFGIRFVPGVVKEDRGLIGMKGRHLYRAEFKMDSLSDEVSEVEMPAVEMRRIGEAIAAG